MSSLSDFEEKVETEKSKDWILLKGTITKTSEKIDDLTQKKKFGLRLDNELNGVWINGFGSCPGQEGDTITLYYAKVPKPMGEGFWYNVKKVESVEETHTNLTEEDHRKIDRSMDKAHIGIMLDAHKFNLMAAVVNRCTKLNILSDKEVYAMFDRYSSYVIKNEVNEDTSGENNGN